MNEGTGAAPAALGPARTLLQGIVLAGGVAAGVAALVAFRVEDVSIYLVFFAVYVLLALPDVEVLPGLRLPVPNMAVTIGFVYIGGLPVLLVRDLAGLLTGLAMRALPPSWRRAFGSPGGARGVFPEVLSPGEGVSRHAVLFEWSTFAIGIAVRWVVAAALAGDGRLSASPGAIAVGEVAGYAAWGLLSVLPVYPDRPLLPLSVERTGFRAALADIQLLVGLALTPFVFLITYGYEAHGLGGAAAWAMSTLGLHFLLKRLTERRVRLEDQNRSLELLNRELEHRERLSAIGKMSSVVSHQILHQLGVIGLYADLIRHAEETAAPEESLRQARKNAGAIEAALGDVNRVLTDLLVFSKDLRLNLYEHDVAAILDECAEECRIEARDRGVLLEREPSSETRAVVDKLKLRQAVGNVVRNAIEASPAGAAVRIGAREDGKWLEIRVTDRGPGILPGDRDAIFAPFFTTREHGTGLGLAIARQFTAAHGGSLGVEEGPGGGASFVFRLPRRPRA